MFLQKACNPRVLIRAVDSIEVAQSAVRKILQALSEDTTAEFIGVVTQRF
jgi:hypothetical protein